MANAGDQKLTKNERREAAREKARELREQQKRKEKRSRLFLQGGIVLGVLAVLGVIVLVVTSSVKPAGPGPANMASDGIVLGAGAEAVRSEALAADAAAIPYEQEAGTVHVQIFLDYLCPHCGTFEQANGDQLRQLVEAGSITLEIRPLAFLDALYSPAASNAAACVANYAPDSFLDFNEAMFVDQQTRDSRALADLVTAVLGEENEQINSCIGDGTFKSWAQKVNDRTIGNVVEGSNNVVVNGTPTVIVNGEQYPGAQDDPAALLQFIQLAESSASSVEQEPSESAEPTE